MSRDCRDDCEKCGREKVPVLMCDIETCPNQQLLCRSCGMAHLAEHAAKRQTRLDRRTGRYKSFGCRGKGAILSVLLLLTGCTFVEYVFTPLCNMDPCIEYRWGEWKPPVPPAPQHEHAYDTKGRCTYHYRYYEPITKTNRAARCPAKKEPQP